MRRRFWTKKIRILMIIAAVVAVFITLGAAMGQGFGVGLGTDLVGSVLSPLRSGIRSLDQQIVNIYDYIYRYETLEAENETLRQELARQNAAMEEAESYRRENQRLRELLELEQENRDYSYLACNIVSWSTSVWESRVTLDKGSSSGVKEGMCAITGTGQVVGIVVDCGSNWATVATIYDVSVRINAKVGPYTGVVQSQRTEAGKQELQMRYLATGADLETGARIVTAGSAQYPDGLLLGTVVSTGMDETGISKFAAVRSELSLDGLEQVFLVTSFQP